MKKTYISREDVLLAMAQSDNKADMADKICRLSPSDIQDIGEVDKLKKENRDLRTIIALLVSNEEDKDTPREALLQRAREMTGVW